jgi:hypothetical protein
MFKKIWTHLYGWVLGYAAYHDTLYYLNLMTQREKADLGLNKYNEYDLARESQLKAIYDYRQLRKT